jgi:hypothetical protein
MFEFGFQNGGQWVMVAIPFSSTISSSLIPQSYELNLNYNQDPSLHFISTTTN